MAFSRTEKAKLEDTTNQTAPYSTPSYTPTANRLLVAHIFARSSGTFTVDPTITANGLTWTFVPGYLAGRYHGICYAQTGASPSAGTFQVDFGALPITGVMVVVEEWDGVSSLTNPVQSTATDNGGSATSASISFLSAPTAAELLVGSFGFANIGSGGTAGTGFTTGSAAAITGPTSSLLTEWRTGTTDPAVTVTMPSSSWNGVIVRFAPAASGDVSVSANPQTVTLTAVAPTVTGGASVSAAVQNMVLNKVAPTVSGGAGYTHTPLGLGLSVVAPSVSGGASVTASPQSILLSIATVIVSTGGDVAVSAGTQTLLLSLLAPSVSGGARYDVPGPSLAIPERRLVLSIPHPTTTGSAQVNVTGPQMTLEVVPPTVSAGARHTASVLVIALSLVHPTVTSGSGTPVFVQAATQLLTLSLPPVVTTVQERNMYGIRTVVVGPIRLR